MPILIAQNFKHSNQRVQWPHQGGEGLCGLESGGGCQAVGMEQSVTQGNKYKNLMPQKKVDYWEQRMSSCIQVLCV